MTDRRTVACAWPQLLTLVETANILRITYGHARTLASLGQLPGQLPFKVGNEYRVNAETLLEWIYGGPEQLQAELRRTLAARLEDHLEGRPPSATVTANSRQAAQAPEAGSRRSTVGTPEPVSGTAPGHVHATHGAPVPTPNDPRQRPTPRQHPSTVGPNSP